MKKFAVLFVLMLSASAFAQNKNLEIKGHVIGESTADFLAKEPAAKQALDICLAKQSKGGRYGHLKKECQATMATYTLGARGSAGTNPEWLFDGGKLVRAYMDSYSIAIRELIALREGATYPWPEAVLQEVIAKLGQPTGDEAVDYHDGLGFQWPIRHVSWTLPGTIVILDIYPERARPESVPEHTHGEWQLTAMATEEYKNELRQSLPKSGVLDR